MRADRYSTYYQENQVLTAGREQLLVLTYDGVLRFLSRARKGIQEGDLHEKHLGITKAQGLIIELRRTLNFSEAPALAHNLARVYTDLLEQLSRADVEDDVDRIGHAIELVSELREAWMELSRRETQ